MERLVSISQAAEILNLSLQGVYYRIKKNQLKSIKQDGKIYVYLDDNIQENTQKKYFDNSIDIKYILKLKDEQISLLKKSLKLQKKQYSSEIKRLEKNQQNIIEVFNSEIKLLQSAFNEMRSLYKTQIEKLSTINDIKKDKDKKKEKKVNKTFISIKDFFNLMEKYNKNYFEIKCIIFQAIKRKDKRFIYNRDNRQLLILNEDFSDLI